MHRDFAQMFAATGAGDALATGQFETCAMHRAHQQALLAAQELPRRPIQATSRMRADIQPGTHAAIGSVVQDERFGIAVYHCLDFVKAICDQPIHL